MKNKIVLDFGCGTGNLTLNFLRLSPISRITAVDIAQRVLDQLAKRVTPEERARIEFVTTDVDSFAKEKCRSFNVICCSGTLHHLPEYVEFHDDGVDEEAIRKVLEDRGYEVSVSAEADKHYRVIYRLSRLFNASSHFTLVAFKKTRAPTFPYTSFRKI